MKIKLFITVCILSSSFISCEKDTNEELIVDPLCKPTSPHYFIGHVGDTNECWNEGENDYLLYDGSGSTAHFSGDTSYYLQYGIFQGPIPEMNKFIFLLFETPFAVDISTQEYYFDRFAIGSYSFHPINPLSRSGIEIQYYENGETYYTASGLQDDSFIKCTEVTNIEQNGLRKIFITWEMKCKLYKYDGSFYKDLSSGKLRVSKILLMH